MNSIIQNKYGFVGLSNYSSKNTWYLFLIGEKNNYFCFKLEVKMIKGLIGSKNRCGGDQS